MARAIYYMPGGVHRSAETLARRAGTTTGGATRTLRVMDDYGLVSRSIGGGWSLTDEGHALLNAVT
jgi:DNA-binding MarR family transcriptional regulator